MDNLYSLIEKVEHHVSSSDDVARVVGYAVLDSLLHFSTSSNSPEEVRFQQVRAVYTSLETFIGKVRDAQDFYPDFAEIQARVDEALKERLAGYSPETGKEHYLLPAILHSLYLHQGHFQDRIRRSGAKLVQGADGKVPGIRNSLLTDYGKIQDAFVQRREE